MNDLKDDTFLLWLVPYALAMAAVVMVVSFAAGDLLVSLLPFTADEITAVCATIGAAASGIAGFWIIPALHTRLVRWRSR